MTITATITTRADVIAMIAWLHDNRMLKFAPCSLGGCLVAAWLKTLDSTIAGVLPSPITSAPRGTVYFETGTTRPMTALEWRIAHAFDSRFANHNTVTATVTADWLTQYADAFVAEAQAL
jgi:hypothetical protein